MYESTSPHDTEADLRLTVEIRLPRHQAEAFAEAMTGNDDDVLLAAETAMRERLGDEELELSYDERDSDVRSYVETEAAIERRSQALYGPVAR